MRALRVFGIVAALGLGFAGCGDDSDPDAIDVKNLKYPQQLNIVDGGDGSVTLSWIASNFEGDFEGYNVYAAKMSDADIAALAEKGLVKGEPIQLLNEEGDPREEAKEILAALDYDTDNDFVLVEEDDESTDEEAEEEDDEPKFSFYPIHVKDSDGDPVLPTCYPVEVEDDSTSFTCTNYTASNVDEVKDEDDGELYAHGTVEYEISGLDFDDQYCFLVFTVQDSGEEISQTSTNFECIRPKYKFSGSFPLVAGKSLDIAEFAAQCKEDGECPSSWGDYSEDATTTVGTGPEELITEIVNTTSWAFTPGQESNCGIKSYGYRAEGLEDPDLPSAAPTFDNAVAESGDDKVANSNGYSARGQSIIIAPNYVYVLACAKEDDSDDIFYYWIHVSGDDATIDNSDTSMTVDIRLSAEAR